MRINILEPTKAYLDLTEEERLKLEKSLTYTNTSVQYLLSKNKRNQWFKRNNFEAWEARNEELKSQLKTSLVFKDKLGYFIRPGSLPYLTQKFDFDRNHIKYPSFRLLSWYKKPSYEPYSYQEESVEKLLEMKHGSIELATGLGKSYILALLVRKIGLKTLIVTPSIAIFQEIYKFFCECFGPNKVGALGDGKKKTDRLITIAVAKSLTSVKGEHLENIKKNQALLVDETHTFAAETLETVCHGILSDIPYRFFLSATITRGDGSLPLLQSIVGPTVLSKDLSWGIKEGYLNPLEFNMVNLPSSNPSYSIQDPMKMKRKHFLYNDNITKFITKTVNAVGSSLNESSLILVEELEQISNLIKGIKVPFSYIHGNTASKADLEKLGLENRDIQEELEKFNRGEIKVLIGTKSISTGTNIYPTHWVFNFQGGSSEIATKQGTMGRSTRLLKNSRYKDFHKPKNVSKIFDFNVDIEEMKRSFFKRLEFYKEADCEIKWINYEPKK
jgi:superfamily II DNA or RNA helicase